MYKLSRTRIAIIIAICMLGVFYAIPNLIPNKSSLPQWWQPVNLGLDLQGGSNLLLEVKVEDVLKERMASVEDSVRQVLRENRIRYQNLVSGDNSVTVVIDNLNSRSKAVSAFRKIDTDLIVNELDDGKIEIAWL